MMATLFDYFAIVGLESSEKAVKFLYILAHLLIKLIL